MDRLKVEIEGKEFTVAGGGFHEMLAAVKEIQGRRWDGDRKLWALPITLEEAKEALSEYQILGDEDELIEAEIAEIKKFQAWILEDEPAIRAEIKKISVEVSRYSFHSRSRIKSGLATDEACLRHALGSARMPIEQLTEIQIRGMKKACELMGWL